MPSRRATLLTLRWAIALWLVVGGACCSAVRPNDAWVYCWVCSGMFVAGLFMLVSGQDVWDIATNPYRQQAVFFRVSGFFARLNGVFWLIPLVVWGSVFVATGSQPRFAEL